MRATHEQPLPGDVVIRAASGADVVSSSPGFVVTIYPVGAPPCRADPTLAAAIEHAGVVATKRGGGIQVWCESQTGGARTYQRVGSDRDASPLVVATGRGSDNGSV